MENNLFSVIIPCYNSAATLSDTINSVINQTYQYWELIIINDGSSDNTVQVIENFSNDKRVKLYTQNNAGVANARNTGINNATGQYLAFLDADDIWHPEKLTKQYEFLLKNDDIPLVYTGNFIFFDDITNSKLNDYKEPFSLKSDYHRLLVSDFIVTSSVCINKLNIEGDIYFREKFIGTEDWDLWIRIARTNKIGLLNQPLVYYREHQIGISKNYDRQLYNDFLVREEHAFKNAQVPKRVKILSGWVLQKKRLFTALKTQSKLWAMAEYLKLVYKFPLLPETYIFPFQFLIKLFRNNKNQ